MPLLGLFLQHKDGTNLMLHTKSRWTVSTAVQATRDFASQVAQLRKEDFGPLGLRNSEPHFAAGRITSLTFYQIAYELLSDVYVAVVQHIDDNPFYSDSTLQRAKSTLNTVCRTDRVGYEEIQKRHIEVWGALEKVLDGNFTEGTDDWAMLDKKNAESRDVLDTLFAVDFEIPAEVLPEARPQHFGQVFGDTANTPTPKQTRRTMASSVSSKKGGGSNLKSSGEQSGKSDRRKLRAATTTSGAITTAFTAMERSGDKKTGTKTSSSKGSRAGSMSPSKGRAKPEAKVDTSMGAADSGSDGGVAPSTDKKGLRLAMPTIAQGSSLASPNTPPGSHKRSHTVGAISTSSDALTSPRSLEGSTDHSVDSTGMTSLGTPTVSSSGVTSTGAFGTPGSQTTPRTSDDSEAVSLPNTPRTKTGDDSSLSTSTRTASSPTSHAHQDKSSSSNDYGSSRPVPEGAEGTATTSAHPSIVTSDADSAIGSRRSSSSFMTMPVPTPRIEDTPIEEEEMGDHMFEHLIISSESEGEDHNDHDFLGASPRLESPTASDTESDRDGLEGSDEDDNELDYCPLPYGSSFGGGGRTSKRNLHPRDRRLSTDFDSDLATTPRGDDFDGLLASSAAAPSSLKLEDASFSLNMSHLSVPSSFTEPEIIITPRSNPSDDPESD